MAPELANFYCLLHLNGGFTEVIFDWLPPYNENPIKNESVFRSLQMTPSKLFHRGTNIWVDLWLNVAPKYYDSFPKV